MSGGWYPSDYDLDFRSGFLIPSDIPAELNPYFGTYKDINTYKRAYNNLITRANIPPPNQPVYITEINQQDRLHHIIDQHNEIPNLPNLPELKDFGFNFNSYSNIEQPQHEEPISVEEYDDPAWYQYYFDKQNNQLPPAYRQQQYRYY